MPRRDDEYEDDDRPRRRPRNDDDYDRPQRSRRRRNEDDEPPPRRRKSGNKLGLILGIVAVVVFLVCGGAIYGIYVVVKRAKKGIDETMTMVQEAQETENSRQNLMHIGRAMHAHHDATGRLPNNSYERRGKQSRPLLSWRVHLLPYLGEDALYRQFKLDEPWDSPNNRRLLEQMPLVYGGPEARKKSGDTKTFYRGFSQRGGIFEKPVVPGAETPRINFGQVPDGLTNTIFVIDAGEAVEWTKPDDIDWSPNRPRPAIGGAYPNFPFVMVLMGDGSVETMRRDVSDQTFRRLVERRDGQIIPPGWDQP